VKTERVSGGDIGAGASAGVGRQGGNSNRPRRHKANRRYDLLFLVRHENTPAGAPCWDDGGWGQRQMFPQTCRVS